MAQDTPETITSQEAPLTGKLFSPPLPSQPHASPLATAAAEPVDGGGKLAGPSAEQLPSLSPAAETLHQQAPAGLSMETIAEEEPSNIQAEDTPPSESLTAAQEEDPRDTELVAGDDPSVRAVEEATLQGEGLESIAEPQEDGLINSKRVRPSKTESLHEQQPVRASKRSKPPAPWR